MKVKIAALAQMVCFCFWGSLLAADDPPLRDELTYATHPGGMVTYEVTIEVGQGDGAESHEGTLRYERDAPDKPGSWMASGSLSVSQSRAQPGRQSTLTQAARDLAAAAEDPFRVVSP